MKKTKVGVIGVGRWGKKHVDEYSKMDNVELLWTSDLKKENLEFCKKNYNVPNVSENYKDVLSSDVDAVSVCTINEQHFEVCKNALQAGKHVLVEKPITPSSKTAYELVNIAKESNKLLAVGHIFRFNNALVETKKLIEEQFFGDIFYLKLQWTALINPVILLDIIVDRRLNVIVDMMPHTFDIMNYLLDSWPKKITCIAKGYRKKDLEDTAYVICEFPKNIMTHTEISWTLPGKVRRVDVIGRNRCAKIDCSNQKVKIFENESEKDLKIEANNTLKSELLHFIDAIERESFLSNDGEIGAKTAELIEYTIKSLEQGKTITL